VKTITVVRPSYQHHIQIIRLSDNAAIQKFLNFGENESNPATSCAEIFIKKPITPSGYYWLRSANGSAVRVFCDMTLTCKGVGGGWMQVAKLNMTNSSHQCPPGTRLRTDLLEYNKTLCGNNFVGPGCSSTTFDIYGIEYTRVCGKIIAYQDSSPDVFGARNIITRSNHIDSNYVDGISLTHGRNPREHIWTFAGALDEVGTYNLWKGYCSCINTMYPASSSQTPTFIGNDYFCDTGSTNRWDRILYPDDPLWDGAGCGPANTCCSLNNPPWFLKQLPSTTTDDIEMRICSDQGYRDEDTPIEFVEIYVK
jgi:hypothetical protein